MDQNMEIKHNTMRLHQGCVLLYSYYFCKHAGLQATGKFICYVETRHCSQRDHVHETNDSKTKQDTVAKLALQWKESMESIKLDLN